MADLPIRHPLFREAVAALDSGDLAALEALLAAHPELVRDRLPEGEGGEAYFHRPYLLWYVAGNPIRHERLPDNIVEIARAIVAAARREAPDDLQKQLDYALGLVSSGEVPRRQGVQIALLDTLVAAGARPDGALLPALGHKEVAAAERLLAHGAALTLTAAVCLGRTDDALRLLPAAAAEERQMALAGAAFYGRAELIPPLLAAGAPVSAYNPKGLHAHSTALHQAVAADSLPAVRALVEAGADLSLEDTIHHGTPLAWAEYLGKAEVAEYLRSRLAAS